MNQKQAIQTYVTNHKCANETLRRLMLWNSKLSLPENAVILKTTPMILRNLVWKYKLGFKKIGKGNYVRRTK